MTENKKSDLCGDTGIRFDAGWTLLRLAPVYVALRVGSGEREEESQRDNPRAPTTPVCDLQAAAEYQANDQTEEKTEKIPNVMLHFVEYSIFFNVYKILCPFVLQSRDWFVYPLITADHGIFML